MWPFLMKIVNFKHLLLAEFAYTGSMQAFGVRPAAGYPLNWLIPLVNFWLN
jgi:hypothetical protein